MTVFREEIEKMRDFKIGHKYQRPQELGEGRG